jgi:hypothetical protein
VKEAALEPFHKQDLPVRHIYDSHSASWTNRYTWIGTHGCSPLRTA